MIDPGPPVEPIGTAGHCVGCGRSSRECGGCQWEYDPPRFCPTCGTRLAVSVTPVGWHARCKHHGDLAPA